MEIHKKNPHTYRFIFPEKHKYTWINFHICTASAHEITQDCNAKPEPSSLITINDNFNSGNTTQPSYVEYIRCMLKIHIPGKAQTHVAQMLMKQLYSWIDNSTYSI